MSALTAIDRRAEQSSLWRTAWMRARRAPVDLLLSLLVFVTLFVFRLTDFGFKNDHFYILTGAREILRGQLPYRDFFEHGMPALLFVSAAIMLPFRNALVGEALLCVSLMSLGTAFAFWLSRHASGSRLIGLVAATIVAIGSSGGCQYFKLWIPLLAFAVMWRYVDTRRPRDLALLAAITAAAGLFRFDVGLYLVVASAVLLAATHWRDGPSVVARRWGWYLGWALLVVSPWVAFVQANGGVRDYVRQLDEFSRRQAVDQPIFLLLHNPPRFAVDPSRPLIRIEPPSPSPRSSISIRWRPGTADDARAQAAATYQLTEIQPIGERSWKYYADDDSAATLSALIGDPSVEDTDGIDRTSYRLNDRPREPALTVWRRAVPLLRLDLLPGVLTVENAGALLFYFVHALPIVATVALGARILRGEPRTAVMPGEIPKLFAVAALAAIWTPVLARPPLARVLETLGPAVILGAWLMGACLRLPRAPRPGGGEDHAASTITRSHRRGVWWPALVMTLVIAGAWAAVAVMTDFGRQLERSGVFEGPGAVAGRVTATVRGLATAPAVDGWAPKGSTGGRALTRYVYECTRPTDDLLILAFEPEMYFYSERGLAARYLFVLAGYWSSMADQRQAIGVLQTRSAPVVLWNRQTFQTVETDFALLHAYLMTRYDTVRESTFGEPGSSTWRVLVDRSAVVSRTYEPLDLPCFAEAPKG